MDYFYATTLQPGSKINLYLSVIFLELKIINPWNFIAGLRLIGTKTFDKYQKENISIKDSQERLLSHPKEFLE